MSKVPELLKNKFVTFDTFNFTIFSLSFPSVSLFLKQTERATNAVLLVQCRTAVSWLLICPSIVRLRKVEVLRLDYRGKIWEISFFPRPAKKSLHCLYWLLNSLGWSVPKFYENRKLRECWGTTVGKHWHHIIVSETFTLVTEWLVTPFVTTLSLFTITHKP